MHVSTNSFHRGVFVLLALVLVGTPGCLSTRYQQVRKPKPATPADISANAGAISARLEAVIVFGGPGSWKREAYWDEYIVTLTNRGDSAATIEAATLVGLANETVGSGTDPWALEKQSRSLEERNFGLVKNTAVNIGGGAGAVGVGAAIGAALGSGGGASGGMYTISSSGLGAAAGAVVAVPIFVGATVYRNIHHRHIVEREFEHRRLALPTILQPGQTRTGSLFFPITPGPRSFTFALRQNTEPDRIEIPLARLSTLHLATAPASTQR